jgi:hypothetical protein
MLFVFYVALASALGKASGLRTMILTESSSVDEPTSIGHHFAAALAANKALTRLDFCDYRLKNADAQSIGAALSTVHVARLAPNSCPSRCVWLTQCFSEEFLAHVVGPVVQSLDRGSSAVSLPWA